MRHHRDIRIPAHRVTSAHLQGAYPFLATSGLGAAGTYIGRDYFGGSFCFDPFELYAEGALTNPNMLVIGSVGSGKSSLVKSLLYRQSCFGRAAWIADPKGEYADIAAALDATCLRLGPGRPTRLNPLDLGSLSEDREAARAQRTRLLATLAATAIQRSLSPLEHTACEIAIDAATKARAEPTLPDASVALLKPAAAAARQLHMSLQELVDGSRDVALVIRRMCAGDLAGMFDAPTSADVDPRAPYVVLDLAEIYQQNREALPLVLTCATAWLTAAVTSTDALRRFVVLDEAWALLSSLATARWLQQSYKLGRAHGIANIAVLHRLSDLTAVGAEGSETVSLARGLLADAGTRVVYAQPPGELSQTRELLGLTSTEAELLPHLAQGSALWKVGTRSFVVEHRRSADEIAMTDTDARMLGATL